MSTCAAAQFGILALTLIAVSLAPASQVALPSLEPYRISEPQAEIALARSAAPPSVSAHAEVLVLGRDAYTTAIEGTNGFVCLVQRSFAAATDFAEFWNPRIRAPICVNAPAARTFLPALLMKAKLALAGRTRDEIAHALQAAYDGNVLPALEPGAMSYMMSKQQYLSDAGKRWHPHMMWFVPGDAAGLWGANLPDSPPIAANDPEDRMTIFLVWVGHWSDGTPAPEQMPTKAYPHAH